MRHQTWNTIEGNALALRIYRSYRRLPDALRAPMRWIAAPVWQSACLYVRSRADSTVLSGPFKGMKLHLTPLSQRHLLGYILGTQELELHPVIEQLAKEHPDTVINVGVADGYYAIGFARLMPWVKVVGFEGLREHHRPFWQTAMVNGVHSRISMKGFCRLPDLRDALRGAGARPLVVCDIEGGEKELLDNQLIPELNAATILVETHDSLLPGCTSLLRQRFSATHDIRSIRARPRLLRDFPAERLKLLVDWVPGTAVELMNERRKGVQEWLVMTPRSPATVER